MALLLNIHTATEIASVSISLDGNSIAYAENNQQREHASFVHSAIQSMSQSSGIALKDIDAFAVTSGPGSYTGLRVGMAAAKGFCYAFSKPLITENTLKVMAKAAIDGLEENEKNRLLCPMIDARRMEVFTAIYDTNLEVIEATHPCILNENSFSSLLSEQMVIFFGSGSAKLKPLKAVKNAVFKEVIFSAKHLADLADKTFQKKNFADISYSEPMYFKDFYSSIKVNV